MNATTESSTALVHNPPSGPVACSTPAHIPVRITSTFPALIMALLFVVGGAASCATVSSTAAGDPYQGKSWDQIRTGLTTPERIVQFLQTCRINYKEETPGTLNHTQGPEETMRLRTGDCEDYAYLITDALTHDGYEARIISVEARRHRGIIIHAVAIYQDPNTNQWHYVHAYRFDGLSIGVSDGFNSKMDLARAIAEKMGGKLHQYFVMSPGEFKATYDVMRN